MLQSNIRTNIEKAIIKGADFIFDCQNDDGGIKFEDEFSVRSGVWVTAEALEFFLSSKVLPVTSFEKIKPMILFLQNSQMETGAWGILAEQSEVEPSTIATGHCVYVLKLAMSGGYYYDKKIVSAVENGEKWLKSCCLEKDGYAFWGSKQVSSTVNPNANERSRMEYVFTSFYALLGMISPTGYLLNEQPNILKKVKRFFLLQAEWFINKYTSRMQTLQLRPNDLAKVASTICRIANALWLLDRNGLTDVKNGLSEIINLCSDHAFMTTSISVNTDHIAQYAATYNNNTPYDMGIALLCLETDLQTLECIINEYLTNQQEAGHWYLNFSSAYTIKTWSTIEALLVLERAYEKYGLMELDFEIQRCNEQITQANEACNQTISQIEEKYKSIFETQNNKEEQLQKDIELLKKKTKKLRMSALISTIISVVLSTVAIILIVVWTTKSENNDTFIANILEIIVLPLAINIVYEVVKSIKNFINT